MKSIRGTEDFYRRPLGGINFLKQPLGINTIRYIVKNMCSSASIDGYFTNHSGKRTCAITLYQSGVDEQEIQRCTRHKSLAIRQYKVPSIEQIKSVSALLEPPTSTSRKALIDHPEEIHLKEDKHCLPNCQTAAGSAMATFNNCAFNFNTK